MSVDNLAEPDAQDETDKLGVFWQTTDFQHSGENLLHQLIKSLL